MTVALFTKRGVITAEIPRIRSVLVIFEPIILPSAMPELPRRPAMVLITSSGMEVPKATTVKPITKEEMPNFLATEDDPSTSISAPLSKKINPTRR